MLWRLVIWIWKFIMFCSRNAISDAATNTDTTDVSDRNSNTDRHTDYDSFTIPVAVALAHAYCNGDTDAHVAGSISSPRCSALTKIDTAPAVGASGSAANSP